MPNNIQIPGGSDTISASHQNSRIEIEWAPGASKLKALITAENGETYSSAITVDDHLTTQELTNMKAYIDKLVEAMLVTNHGGSVV